MIDLRRSTQSTTHAFISGSNFGGIASVAELRRMATPEFAAQCSALADEIDGPVRQMLREATRDSERTLARAEKCPPTQRGDR